MTTMTMIHNDTILDALDGADTAWRARLDDSRLGNPGQALEADAAALAMDAPSDLLCGYVLGLYALNARH